MLIEGLNNNVNSILNMDDSEIEDIFPELFEDHVPGHKKKKVDEDETEAAAREESEKQKKQITKDFTST